MKRLLIGERMTSTRAVLAVLVLVSLLVTGVHAAQFPSNVNGLGVDIHLWGDTPNLTQDLNMIQAAGVKEVRMDFPWNWIETKKGVYNFTNSDILCRVLSRRRAAMTDKTPLN